MKRFNVKYFKKIIMLGIFLNWAIILRAQPADDMLLKSLNARPNAYILSLDEVSRLALLNNFDIQLAKYDAWIARTGQGVAESIYDTLLNAEIKYTRDESKPTSIILGTKTLDNDYDLSLEKKLPTGTRITIDTANNRNWSNSSFLTLNPSHDSSLGFTVVQELGRNFFGIQDKGGIKITKLDIQNSEYTSLSKIENSLADAQRAYWALVLEIEHVRIEEDMVDQAKRLYDLNKDKLNNGLVEKPDVLASEANYKGRVNQLIMAQNTLKSRENTLRFMLNITDEGVSFVPIEQFSLPKDNEQLDMSLKYAFENRYDYKQASNIIEKRNIKLSMTKNGLWPEINLTASFERNGVDDHFNQAGRQVIDEDNPTYFAGLSVSFPLENTESRAGFKAAKLQKAKAIVNLKQVERKITVTVMDSVRNCNTLKEVAGNASMISGLQADKLAEEQKRFNRGRSDTDTIIRFQDDLARARLEAAQAKYDYYSSVIDLRIAEGSLLNTYWEGEL